MSGTALDELMDTLVERIADRVAQKLRVDEPRPVAPVRASAYVGVREMAELSGWSATEVRRMLHEGVIPGLLVGTGKRKLTVNRQQFVVWLRGRELAGRARQGTARELAEGRRKSA